MRYNPFTVYNIMASFLFCKEDFLEESVFYSYDATIGYSPTLQLIMYYVIIRYSPVSASAATDFHIAASIRQYRLLKMTETHYLDMIRHPKVP